MPTALEALAEFKTKREALEKQIKKEGKTLFKEAAAELFEKHSTLVSFSWTQYTPYWNDGDTCLFSAGIDEIFLKTTNQVPESTEDDEDHDDEDDIFSSYSIDDKKHMTPREKAGMDVLKFLKNFDDDSLESMFGDHAKVIVTAKGVKVEEYEHD